MRKLTLFIIMIIGLALPIGLASAASGHVLWIHDGDTNSSACVEHYPLYTVSRDTYFNITWEVTLRNWDGHSIVPLMYVNIYNASNWDTSTNKGHLGAAWFLMNSSGFVALYGNGTNGDASEVNNCNPLTGWCNISIVIYIDRVEFYVNNHLIWNYTAWKEKGLDTTEKRITSLGAGITGWDNTSRFDLYIDNVVEKHGDTTYDSYFTHYFFGSGDILISVVNISEVPPASPSGGGHSFDIPSATLLLLAGLGALALMRRS